MTRCIHRFVMRTWGKRQGTLKAVQGGRSERDAGMTALFCFLSPDPQASRPSNLDHLIHLSTAKRTPESLHEAGTSPHSSPMPTLFPFMCSCSTFPKTQGC